MYISKKVTTQERIGQNSQVGVSQNQKWPISMKKCQALPVIRRHIETVNTSF